MKSPDTAEVAPQVIGECARFGARLRELTLLLGRAPVVAAEREELTRAIAYAHAALADLLITVQPIHQDDLRRILGADGRCSHPAADGGPCPICTGSPGGRRGTQEAPSGPATRQHPSVRDMPWVATA
ncbi:hypothetical protein GBF35_39700 [Nonomuraea phyllanthi]|uniref:hypothetical protein n=1 Tax=Nonomuraea phyllanthi TaxID=2219224 RepID=UPI0012931BF5|nr:hypothetical protein [Nonomuraea phyllanthi]QFY11888.1 hypothetical protein GBF35_39700 [Nonomuraea phyllanthi]